MVGTICPVGNGTRNLRQRFFDSACFLAGCTLGGLALGSVLATIGESLVSPLADDLTMVLTLSTFSVIAIAAEFGLIAPRISPFPRQVASISWEIYRRPVVAFRWGIEQGVGLLTHVAWIGFHVALLTSILVGFPLGVVIMAAFGIVRGLQPLIMLSLAHLSAEPDGFYDRFSRTFPTFAWLRAASLLAIAFVPTAFVIGEIA